jgi:hypothetical protein
MVYRALFYMTAGFFFVSLFGCREINHYGYTSPSQDILGGTLSVKVVGNFGEEYERNGQKKTDWGFPYNLQFSYVVPKGNSLRKLKLKDIEITGMESGNHYELAPVESDKVRVYGADKLIRVSVGPLTEDRFKYEDYRLEMTVIVFGAESEASRESLSLVLKTDYRTEKRSDWFDEKTSI